MNEDDPIPIHDGPIDPTPKPARRKPFAPGSESAKREAEANKRVPLAPDPPEVKADAMAVAAESASFYKFARESTAPSPAPATEEPDRIPLASDTFDVQPQPVPSVQPVRGPEAIDPAALDRLSEAMERLAEITESGNKEPEKKTESREEPQAKPGGIEGLLGSVFAENQAKLTGMFGGIVAKFGGQTAARLASGGANLLMQRASAGPSYSSPSDEGSSRDRPQDERMTGVRSGPKADSKVEPVQSQLRRSSPRASSTEARSIDRAKGKPGSSLTNATRGRMPGGSGSKAAQVAGRAGKAASTAGRAAQAAGGAGRAAAMAGSAGGAGAAGGAAAGAAAALGPVAVAAGLVVGFKELHDAVVAGAKAQQAANFELAQYSAAMANVKAHADIDNIMRQREIGDRTAGTAAELAGANRDYDEGTKELSIAFANFKNVAFSAMLDAITQMMKPIEACAKAADWWMGEKGNEEKKGFDGLYEQAVKHQADARARGDDAFGRRRFD